MQSLGALLEDGQRQGVFPAAAAWVGQADAPPWRYFVGDCNQDTLWDLASLTKPMVVVTQMMRLVERHALDLRERVGPFEICELLAHRSGLLAHDHLVSWLDAQGRFVRVCVC